MIQYTTTLSAYCLATDGAVLLTAVTGITGPGTNKTTRTNIWIDRECMEVSAAPSGLSVPVVRGTNGTLREYHAIGEQVWIGAEIDFTDFTGWDEPGLGTYGSLGTAFSTTLVTLLAGTNQTLTEAMLLGGEIIGTPTAAGNYTLPTAALLLAAIGAFVEQPWIGITFYFNILNTSAGAFTITLVAGTGVTLNPAAQTVVQNASSRYKVVFTSVGVGSAAAYTVFPA
jgi:hypothetical protein